MIALPTAYQLVEVGNAPRNSSIRSQTEETFVEVIMGKQRQSWSVEEKLAIVLAVLSERQSVAEVSAANGASTRIKFIAGKSSFWKRVAKG
jgi:hypothetical protein